MCKDEREFLNEHTMSTLIFLVRPLKNGVLIWKLEIKMDNFKDQFLVYSCSYNGNFVFVIKVLVVVIVCQDFRSIHYRLFLGENI